MQNMGVKHVHYQLLSACLCSILCIVWCSATTYTEKADCSQPEFYGENCSLSCSDCVDGVCVGGECDRGCKLGKWGPHCDKDCPSRCHACEQQEGFCMVCHPPDKAPYFPNHYGSCYSDKPMDWPDTFTSTTSCKKPGVYGPDCNDTCPESCAKREGQEVAICDRFSGACLKEGCVSGRFDWMCDRDCNHLCSGKKCHRRTAECSSGCVEGWEGDWCGIRETDTGAIVGSVFGVLIVLGIIAGVAYYILVIRKSKSSNLNDAEGSPQECSHDSS